jgi:hypothetical protein
MDVIPALTRISLLNGQNYPLHISSYLVLYLISVSEISSNQGKILTYGTLVCSQSGQQAPQLV